MVQNHLWGRRPPRITGIKRWSAIDLKRTYVGIPPAKHFKDMTTEEIGDIHFKYARDNHREQPKISSSLSNKFRNPEDYL